MSDAKIQSLLHEWRVVAARVRLQIIHSWEVPPIADRLLNACIYSPSLAEVATRRDPIMSELAPMVFASLEELEIEVPSFVGAASFLARFHIERSAAEGLGDDPLWKLWPLLAVYSVVRDRSERDLSRECHDERLALAEFERTYWGYQYNTFDIDAKPGHVLRREMIDWIERHPV